MILLKIILWVSIFLIFYSYLGYGLLIWFLLKLRGNQENANHTSIDNGALFEPEVTLVIATYNEEAILVKKIENSFMLDYPADKLKIIIIADGSTDSSKDIILTYKRIELMYKPGREGKVAAINRAMEKVTTPYVIFSDANTLLNRECVREIVKHYQDPNIGAVAGEKKVVDLSGTQNTAGAGEGLYWKYESMLKRLDSRYYSVVGAAGELFSLRTGLFEPVANNILLDDFILSMKICKRGFRVMYEPNAYAAEAPSMTMRDERKRKIRISAGGFQSVILLKELLNIFKYGKLSFQYISHRVLRWALCPVLLPLIFLINLYIYFSSQELLYYLLLMLQAGFYLSAMIGWILTLQNIKSRIFYIPYYFVFMNVSLYIGFFRFINNRQTVLWDKAARKL